MNYDQASEIAGPQITTLIETNYERAAQLGMIALFLVMYEVGHMDKDELLTELLAMQTKIEALAADVTNGFVGNLRKTPQNWKKVKAGK